MCIFFENKSFSGFLQLQMQSKKFKFSIYEISLFHHIFICANKALEYLHCLPLIFKFVCIAFITTFCATNEYGPVSRSKVLSWKFYMHT